MKTIRQITGSVVAPLGFRAAGVFCDIKRLGTGKGSAKGRKRDLGLIISEVPAVAAGMFTTNQVCAAPVKLCIERLKKGVARGVVVNSGNANACTGPQGMKDAREMADLTAEELGMDAGELLVASTGRIGVPLPMEQIRRGIRDAAWQLNSTSASGDAVAEAIMTSDTRPKQIAVEFVAGGKKVRLGGICKGAGMIQPGMSPDGRRPASFPRGLHATMLCFLTTDAAMAADALGEMLREAVAQSFNRITVDGDMSTNDTVLLLANGLAGNQPITRRGGSAAGRTAFQAALNHVCLELARMIVRDGEGVTRTVTVRVSGARNDREADQAARAVANSALVKTSWNGGDPNWGRIMDALGYSPAAVAEEEVSIGYSAPGKRKIVWSVRRGRPARVSFEKLCREVARPEFDLHIDLGMGKGGAWIYAADLSEAYVDFNKGDVSDPASLGG